MKLNCGPTEYERWLAKREWHRWFAWHPVRFGSHDCRWMEVVERRMNSVYAGHYYEYRSIPAGGE